MVWNLASGVGKISKLGGKWMTKVDGTFHQLYTADQRSTPEDETDDPASKNGFTNPCSPPDEEESPESDRLPVSIRTFHSLIVR